MIFQAAVRINFPVQAGEHQDTMVSRRSTFPESSISAEAGYNGVILHGRIGRDSSHFPLSTVKFQHVLSSPRP
jgi:hypothetical protein